MSKTAARAVVVMDALPLVAGTALTFFKDGPNIASAGVVTE
ncbi:MAG: hypothetical protein AAGF74_09365 [Pseudomonadota bacterium]